MSQLWRFRVLTEEITLRVDALELFDLADRLFSIACSGPTLCDANEPADLIWSHAGDGSWRLIKGGISRQTASREDLYFTTENELNLLFAERFDDCLQLHAAGATGPAGKTWLICGPSRAGKTSLLLSLALAGWRWLTDEHILFTQDEPLRVRGIRRNFNLKEGSFPLYPETAGLTHNCELFSAARQCQVRFFDPSDLALQPAEEPAKIIGIVFPEYDGELKEPEIRSLSPMETTQRLLEQVACWQPWAPPLLARVAAETAAWHYRYSQPREITRLVQTMEKTDTDFTANERP